MQEEIRWQQGRREHSTIATDWWPELSPACQERRVHTWSWPTHCPLPTVKSGVIFGTGRLWLVLRWQWGMEGSGGRHGRPVRLGEETRATPPTTLVHQVPHPLTTTGQPCHSEIAQVLRPDRTPAHWTKMDVNKTDCKIMEVNFERMIKVTRILQQGIWRFG